MTTNPAANREGRDELSADVLASKLRQVLIDDRTRPALFQPTLTVVGLTVTTTDVLQRCLDRPEQAIIGYHLPARYQAIGVLASSVVATPPSRVHTDAALALGVTRSGRVVSLLEAGGQVQETRSPQGWLIDACRRCVGLETAPCEISPLVLPIALWLDRLMVAIMNAPAASPIDWNDAVALCPIPAPWRSQDPFDLGITLGSTTRSWRKLRAASSVGHASICGVSALTAQWMDDAMFARWCVGSFPDLENLRSDVEFLASDEVAGNVALTLRAAWSAFAG